MVNTVVTPGPPALQGAGILGQSQQLDKEALCQLTQRQLTQNINTYRQCMYATFFNERVRDDESSKRVVMLRSIHYLFLT